MARPANPAAWVFLVMATVLAIGKDIGAGVSLAATMEVYDGRPGGVVGLTAMETPLSIAAILSNAPATEDIARLLSTSESLELPWGRRRWRSPC